MINIQLSTGRAECSVGIVGTDRYRTSWRLMEARPNAWIVCRLSVIDLLGIDPPIVLAESDSLWEGATRVNQIGHMENSALADPYTGLLHNIGNQTALGSTIIGDGVGLSTSKDGMLAAYIEQHHSFLTPTQLVDAGRYSVYHMFTPEKLAIEATWNFEPGIEEKMLYSSAVPVTTRTAGGLRCVDIPTKPTLCSVNDGQIHFGDDVFTPDHAVFWNPAHRFELLVEWPLGCGRPIGGEPTWANAQAERCFVHDTMPSNASPNGLMKLYQCFLSGDWRPAISSDHITHYTVRMVTR